MTETITTPSPANEGPRRVGFTLDPDEKSTLLQDENASEPPSRAESDTSSSDIYREGSPGNIPEDVYEQLMGWWRAAIRRRLVKQVEWESPIIAAMQHRIRSPLLDSFFVYTSALGTHTFFMIALPACFFFGLHRLGRGIIFVVVFSGYVTSFIKDLICSPRPFAPPVTRLSIGTHHLEYGFPSTHSANAVSMALFGVMFISRLLAADTITLNTYYFLCGVFAFYTFSIVYGRLYTGMHSFVDVGAGSVAGALVWLVYWLFEDQMERWISGPGWEVPILTTTVGLIMVHKHPQPVDDCPCFEDAIAFISVVMGCVLGQWHSTLYALDHTFYTHTMPGGAWASWADVATWWLFVALKMVFGTFAIFAWRMIAKPTLHTLLPPIFRLLAQDFELPHRRFYTPATDYKSVPAEKGLHPIPSVIDLPSQFEEVVDGDVRGRASMSVGGASREDEAAPGREKKKVDIVCADGKSRGIYLNTSDELGLGADDEVDVVKHYDADVLTKVFVYCGIAIISVEILPILFELMGWGVRPW